MYNYLLAGQCTLRVLAAGQLITQHHNPCADRLNGWMRIVTTPRRISSFYLRDVEEDTHTVGQTIHFDTNKSFEFS